MRESFAHDAVLAMAPGADTRAPGGAVTEALCGHMDHAPPCPLAPHHTRASRRGDQVVVRILFATEPGREPDVRQRIESALDTGQFGAPDGVVTRWRVVSQSRSSVTADEADHAARL